MIFSGDETTDVGSDVGSPVAEEYGVRGNEFTGAVNWVQIDLGADDADHLISAEERWRVALAIQ
jgi:arylsulfatase